SVLHDGGRISSFRKRVDESLWLQVRSIVVDRQDPAGEVERRGLDAVQGHQSAIDTDRAPDASV
ncbi:MAG: hypothetical protein ACI8WY_001612, partial [Planctomycetota bacterium]